MSGLASSLSIAAFAGEIRRFTLADLEERRANRAPDQAAPLPQYQPGPPLPADLVTRLISFVGDDEALDQVLPDDLAGELRGAAQAAPPPCSRRSPLALSKARARLSDGRAARLELALRVNDLDVVAPVVEATLARLGMVLPPEKQPIARRAALRVLAEAYREDARRERGQYCDPPERDMALGVPLTANPAQSGLTQTTPAQAIAPTSPLLSEEAEAAKKRRLQAKGDPKTLRDMDLAVRLFGEIVGDMRIGEMRWTNVAAFRDQAMALPKLHGKGLFDNLTGPRAIQLADAIDVGNRALVEDVLGLERAEAAMRLRPVERISKKTVNKHLSSLKFVVKDWCDRNSEQKRTPFDREFIPKKEAAADARVFRVALSDEDIRHLFGSPRFTGHGDDALRATAGTDLVRDGRYWVPLLGIHQGMRLEEVLQLGPGDIETVDGVVVITIGKTPDVRVKTEFSRRRIPVHPALVRLGLLDHAAEMRRQGQRKLFPDVQRGGPDGRFGYYFSKEFTEYRREIGFYRPGADLHALRHTLATRLFNTDADTSMVAAILGHVQQGVTAGVYLSGYKLRKLAEALARVDFGIEGILSSVRR